MEITDIIKKPILTEKTLRLAQEENTYSFIVDRRANKNQIKEAVEKQFEVAVSDIRVINRRGKTKRRGAARGIEVRMPDAKRALVRLKEGDKIKAFELK